MLNFNCKRKTAFLIIIFLLIISLLTALSVVNINYVYADNSIGDYNLSEAYWKDNFNWKSNLRPQYTNCSITRIGTNKYRVNASIEMGDGLRAGVGWWTCDVLYNDTSVAYIGKVNEADIKHTFSGEFTHNDKLPITIKFKVHSNWSSINATNTSDSKTFSAYNKNAPTGTLNGVSNGGTTNSNVSFTWSEANCTAKLDGQSYTSGTSITGVENGKKDYTLILTDIAGNNTTYTFTIDKTPPNFTIKDENNNILNTTAITNKNVYVEWSSSQLGTLAIKKNNIEYIPEYHTKYYYDSLLPDNKWFNKSDLTVNIYNKEKALVQTKTYSGGNVAEEDKNDAVVGNTAYLYNNLYYFKQSSLDKAINQTINIRLITVDKWYLKEEGIYNFTFTNSLGTQTNKTITIDKTAPTGTLSGVENSGICNNNVSFTWNEDGAAATLNGAPYTKNSVIYPANGKLENYTLILSDRAGNTTTYTFSIDRESPTGTLSGVENGGATNSDVSFTWNEDNCTATLNGANYQKNTTIQAEGNFTIILKDRFNNETIYTFTIDKTPPKGALNGVENNGITNNNVTFTWSEDGASATLNGINYTKNSIINQENRYELILTDSVGNSITYKFTIDKTPPTGTLSGVENGGICNNNVYFTWDEDNCTATLNSSNYQNNTVILGETNKEKQYTLILSDLAGNTTTYTFTIDKVLPTLEFYKNGVKLDVSYQEMFFINENITIKYPNSLIVKINGNLIDNSHAENIYSLESEINKSFVYEIEITNILGNKNNYSITIDKIAPTENLNHFLSVGKNYINHWWETYESSLIDGKFVATNYYSFINYALSKNFAMQREASQFEYGIYDGSGKIYCNYAKKYVDGFDIFNPRLGQNYTIYKDANNSNRLIAYFDNANLINAQQNHSENSIRECFVPTTPNAEHYENTVFIKDIYLSGNEFTFMYAPKNTDIYYTYNPAATESDFIKTNYNQVFTSSYTKFMEIDKAGNKVIYTIYLDNNPPSALAYDANNNYLNDLSNLLNEGRDKVYFTDVFTLMIDDTLDYNAVLVISKNNNVIKRIFAGENETSYTFEYSGIYTLEWYDKVGNKQSTTLYLALEEIKVSFSEVKDDNHSVVGFEMNLDKINSFNNIVGININFTSLDGESFILSPSTMPSFNFSSDIFNYTFNVNGTYKITITDDFGRHIDYEYILQKGLPVGNLYDKATDTELANNSTVGGPKYTNTGQGIYFTWQDDTLTCKYSLNDGTLFNYIANTMLTGVAGELTKITFYLSSDNLTSTYVIYIDIEPIKITVDGVTINSATNKNVTLSWDAASKGTVFVKFKNQSFKKILNFTTFSESGSYSVRTEDPFGNVDTFNFIIDKNAPIITAYTRSGAIINNIYTNKDFYFDWGGEEVTATVNGIPYEEGTIISSDGNYSIIIIDYLGNTSSLNIVRDTILNDAIFTGLNNKNWANDIVTATWTDIDVTATLNGEIYLSGDVIDTDINTLTEFTLILSDKAGNKKTYVFTISRILPTGSLSGVENDGVTNKNVYLSWSYSYYIATLNNEIYTSGTLIKVEGFYTLVLMDVRNNNETIYTFTIDKTAPTGTLSGVENGGKTNQNVTFSWNEDGASATLNEVAYNSGNYIIESGNYTLILKDIAGNKTEYTFTIDKIPPKGTLSGVENGGITNKTVSLTWYESNCIATLNGSNYVSSTPIKESGKYELILTDSVGNTTLYTFVIDKSLPYATFYNEYDNILNMNSESNIFNVSIYINILNEFSAVLNNTEYFSNTLITEEGTYQLIITNYLGNSIAYTFTIDKTAPTGELNGVENNGITNKNVSLTWYENQATCTISINGSNYSNYISGTLLRETGKYTLVLSDRVGNSITYSFTIIKEKPFATSVGLNENNYSNNNVVFYFSDDYTATLNGGNYISGTTITEEGNYELIVFNCINDSVSYPFIIDKTAPIITITNNLDEILTDTYLSIPFIVKTNKLCDIYLNDVIYNSQLIQNNNAYYITAIDLAGNTSTHFINLNNEKPEVFFNVDFINNKTAKDVSFEWSEDNDTAIVTLNNETYIANTIISKEGTYNVYIVNKYGADNSYTFTIDKTPPKYTITGAENEGITNKKVKVEFFSSYSSYLIKNNNIEESTEYFPNQIIEGELNTLTKYELVIINTLGAEVHLFFTIDRTLPVGELLGVENGGSCNNEVTFTWSEDGASATLNGEVYLSGSIIDVKENSKKIYEIILTNYIGNQSIYTFTIDKRLPAPQTNIPTSIINKDFNIKFDAQYKATLNGNNYVSGALIKDSGNYTFILMDSLGNKTEYTFTIDRTEINFIINSNNEEISINKNTTFTNPINLIYPYKFTVNGVEQKTGYLLSATGKYEIVVYSEFGTTSSFTITITQPEPKYSVGDILVFCILGLLSFSLFIGFTILIFKAVKNNNKKIL